MQPEEDRNGKEPKLLTENKGFDPIAVKICSKGAPEPKRFCKPALSLRFSDYTPKTENLLRSFERDNVSYVK